MDEEPLADAPERKQWARARQLYEFVIIDTRAALSEDVLVFLDSADLILQVLTYDTTNVTWVTMNAPRLKTPEVRQGFSYAFPYDHVADGAYKGLLTRTSGPRPIANSRIK